MTKPTSSEIAPAPEDDGLFDTAPICVMSFNANDPSGCGGLVADITTMASAGGHPLSVVTGTYVRDTNEIFDHVTFDHETVLEQARSALEDMSVGAIKVGFVGDPANIAVIADIASDYTDVPVIAYMPNLSWWNEREIDRYLDAFGELMLPQTTVLVGNYTTLWRWLLADWDGKNSPSAHDLAVAAAKLGAPYTLVTGINLPGQFIDNVLVGEQGILFSKNYEQFEAVFTGAGDTLTAALTALLANGTELPQATQEALKFLDQTLYQGFQPGMGKAVPDRMFWAQLASDEEETENHDEPTKH